MSAETLRHIDQFIDRMPWPSRVGPQDIVTLNERRQQGGANFAIAGLINREYRELGVGILSTDLSPVFTGNAHADILRKFMDSSKDPNLSFEEARRQFLQDRRERNEALQHEYTAYALEGLNYYTRSTFMVLSAEEIVRNGNLTRPFLVDVVVNTNFWGTKLGSIFSVPDEIKVQQANQWRNDAERYADRLMEGVATSEVVDEYTQAELERLAKPSGNPFRDSLKRKALERGRQRFHQLLSAWQDSQHTNAAEVTTRGIEDFSGSEAVDLVAGFLQGLSFQNETESQKFKEFHGLMTDIGKLSEALIPHMERREWADEDEPDDPSPIASMLLLPPGILAEDWMYDDIDEDGRIDHFRNGNLSVQILDALPEFAPGIQVILEHNPDADPDEPLADKEDIEESTQPGNRIITMRDVGIPLDMPFSTGAVRHDRLSMPINTDPQTTYEVERQIRMNPGLDSSVRNRTTFYFDSLGKYVKTCTIPADIHDERAPLEDNLRDAKTLLSEMTEQDFQLVTQALNRVKEVLSTNLQRLQSGDTGKTIFS